MDYLNILIFLTAFLFSQFNFAISTEANSPCLDFDCSKLTSTEASAKINACKIMMKTSDCLSLGADVILRDCKSEALEPNTLEESYIWGCLVGTKDFITNVITAPWEMLKLAATQTKYESKYFNSELYRTCKEAEEKIKSRKLPTKELDCEQTLFHGACPRTLVKNCKNSLLENFPDIKASYGWKYFQTPYDQVLIDVHARLRKIREAEPSLVKFIEEHPHKPIQALREAVNQALETRLACLSPKEFSRFSCDTVLFAFTATYGALRLIPKASNVGQTLRSTEAILVTKEYTSLKPTDLTIHISNSKIVQNLFLFKPKPYKYDVDISAANNGPVFVVAAVNSSNDLRKIKTITGKTIDSLTEFMKACRNSWGKGIKGSCLGFIKDEEKLRDVLVRDNDFILSQGLTHQQVATPLLEIMQEFEKLKHASSEKRSLFVNWNGRAYEITANRRGEGNIFSNELAHSGWIGEARANGLQGSPFNDQIYNTMEFSIRDIKTGSILKGEGLTPHLIYRYGFYQSGPFRMEPREIINFFHLQNKPE